VPSNTSMSMLSTAVTRVRAAVSSNEQYVNFYSGVARADRGPFVLSPGVYGVRMSAVPPALSRAAAHGRCTARQSLSARHSGAGPLSVTKGVS